VANDIKFRKALEKASNESARMLPQETEDGPKAEELEDLIRMASSRSILDEQARQLEAEKKYKAELELVLQESQLKQVEENNTKETEEEVLRKVLLQSQAEEEKQMEEEEALERVMRESMMDNANVGEDELVEEAMKTSLSESEHGRLSLRDGSGGEQQPTMSADDMLEQVLKLSLEEKQRVAKEEEEEMRVALEWSMRESSTMDLTRGISRCSCAVMNSIV